MATRAFQISDIWTGTTKNLRNAWQQQASGDTPPADGQACPICDEREPEPDAQGKRWQTLFCDYTVCTSCVRGWMSSELDVNAAVQSAEVKFTCPACSSPMRTADAHDALSRHPSVTRRYELLSRDATLRTMPEWRSCPKCSGGGFCTPECLAPRHDEAEEDATKKGWQCQGMLYSLVWLVLLNTFRAHPLHVTVLAMGATATTAFYLRRTSRRWVSGINTEPLAVTCPDCEVDFLLKDYSQALGHMNQADADAETERWIKSNMRPCPSCGTAIQKINGCNARAPSAGLA